MANYNGDRHAVLDTFTADIQIQAGRIDLISITLLCAGAEVAVFNNKAGYPIAIVGGPNNVVDHFTPSQPVGCDGLIFDNTASSVESASDVIILHYDKRQRKWLITQEPDTL